MKFARTLASTMVAATLVAAPVVAQASAPSQRLGADVKGEELRGGFIIPLLALIAVILGIIAATSGNNGDLPRSP
ncbi:MAG: hypothetical protein ABIT09_04315 [Croceibacterium sp.]